jgi:hypothetical protein
MKWSHRVVPKDFRPNPYCSFKDDRQRRWALLARDVRLVLIALAGSAASWSPTALQWFTRHWPF